MLAMRLRVISLARALQVKYLQARKMDSGSAFASTCYRIATIVLTGELSQKTPSGVRHVDAGHSMPGNAPDTPMEVSSSGTGDLKVLVMFVADATKPFS